MKIAFHGAARTVTGSKHLLTLKTGKKFFWIADMFQGMGQDTDTFNRDFGFEPSEVDVDDPFACPYRSQRPNTQAGQRRGFSGKIFCTSATRELTKIVAGRLRGDTANDVQYSNKRRLAEGQILLQPFIQLRMREDHLTPLPNCNTASGSK